MSLVSMQIRFLTRKSNIAHDLPLKGNHERALQVIGGFLKWNRATHYRLSSTVASNGNLRFRPIDTPTRKSMPTAISRPKPWLFVNGLDPEDGVGIDSSESQCFNTLFIRRSQSVLALLLPVGTYERK